MGSIAIWEKGGETQLIFACAVYEQEEKKETKILLCWLKTVVF